jgi:hypothetical protein
MGTMVQALCQCGFESGILGFGGGWSNFTTYCGAPALCQACGALQVANYLDESSRCARCGGPVVYYDDPRLWANADDTPADSSHFSLWNLEGGRVFRLPDTHCLCPKCGQMTLRFMDIGCWD